MTSYNKLNGTYVSENRNLLNGLLREEWNFEGPIMTDWYSHGMKKPKESTYAGNDLLMPGGTQNILSESKSKRNRKYIEEAAARILPTIMNSDRFAAEYNVTLPTYDTRKFNTTMIANGSNY